MRYFGIIGQGVRNIIESFILWINNTKNLKYSQMARNIVMIFCVIFIYELVKHLVLFESLPISIKLLIGAIFTFAFIILLIIERNNETLRKALRTDEIIKAVRQGIDAEREKDKAISQERYDKTSEIEDKARSLTKSLITSLNAEVATCELLHNTDVWDGGVHCRYYDEAYSSTKEGVFFDARTYQRMPTSIFPVVSYIEKRDYLFLPTERLKKIDMAYTKAIEENGYKHLAMKFMRRSNGKPLGILTCSWRDTNGEFMPSEEVIKKRMKITAAKLEAILDLEN